MATSPYELILDATVTTVAGLGLVYGADSLAVVRRKFPQVREDIDAVPAAYVCPHHRPENWQRFSSEGWLLVSYLVWLVFVAASNRDPELNLCDPLSWRKACVDAFSVTAPMPSVPTWYSLDVIPEVPLDLAAFQQQFDMSVMALRVHSLEQVEG